MKRKNAFLKLGLLFLTIPLFASCGFVKTKDTGLIIKGITHDVLDNGDILLTITYNDKKGTTDSFIIPKGEVGEDGVGIESITPEVNKVTGETTITIVFTDPSIPSKVFVVPQGRGIKEVITDKDDSGNTTFKFIFTDGSASEVYTVNKGADGIGIAGYDEPVTNIDGSISFTIHLTNGTHFVLTIPPGKTGNGIDHMESGETEDKYYLSIFYTDGTEDIFYFDKPVPAAWTYVHTMPSDSEGNIGDFAFDDDHDKIYYKTDDGSNTGKWIEIVNFATNDTTWNVAFDLNALDATRVGGQAQYTIHNGHTFYSSNYVLPLAVRSGYEFGGWSTSKTPNVTNGLFTDLTPVLSDMTLYAVWVD